MIETRTCLLPMITQQTHHYVRLYQHYRRGVLPLNGGLLDQPAPYLEAMELIDGNTN